ncbi:DUF4166 domain-containing protein [Bradyrhizobium sp. SYSU BS000235]|uniref:DUF4166 domain-containing protein n=1 Tax=Bradyrhizobium sp. SYSU BS000235 TaxID=3411332 RepID=UPI003C78936D
MRRVLLIGATGAFGSRLAALLATFTNIELVLAARGLTALTQLRNDLVNQYPAARITVQQFDRSRADSIASISPWLVIDTAGPFQDTDYGLAQTAIGCGAHYIDIADARRFVANFAEALDAQARTAGVLAVTGASSTPALSHAVLAPLVTGWRRLDDVIVAICPGAKAPRGLSVIQAILSYVGRPVRVFSNGHWISSPGWSGARRLAIPGLGRRWTSLCETPDLDMLPAHFPIQRTALFLAGVEPGLMHLGLTALSLPVRWGLISSLKRLARPLRFVAGLLDRFGSDRGGMLVQASGADHKGRNVVARWSLLARDNAGPSVPIAAAAAMVRGLLDNRITQTGAQACVGLLKPEAILCELQHLPVMTREDEAWPDHATLFRRLLGRHVDDLPQAVRSVHDQERAGTFAGTAIARTGRGWPARLLRWLVGLPKSGRYPVVVKMTADKTGESWARQFGESSFRSRLQSTSQIATFEEQFGPLRFTFDLARTERGVDWRFLGWSFLALPLPAWAAPKIRATATEANSRYRFNVAVQHPALGLLFAYRGTLFVEQESAPQSHTAYEATCG